MILFDEVVKLRAIEESDAPVLMELINDPEIEKNVLGFSFPVSLMQQKKWIAEAVDEKTIRYAIDVGEKCIGVAIISAIDYKNGTCRLGIKLKRDARGNGYARRSVRLMIQYCFDELNLNCLAADVLEYNIDSKKLWEKMGFSLDGVLRERIYKNGKRHNLFTFSLLCNEYRKQKME